MDQREVTGFPKLVPGHGVQGEIDGTMYFLGNRKMIADVAGLDTNKINRKMMRLEEAGKTAMILATKENWSAS